ncbi:GPALPP motifs-containing protein 1 [Culex pipiens pallens]|uniref:GPALPP motifs-containing protein 1 n=1 Tax=Culex pipiens pallens TaxID=42434 RepID=UPI0019530334|nr:GPALPP motifs-containing protein 1 [Culex pipiens pallens]
MSDSDTSDSDSGIRFKTTSTRYKSHGADKYGSSTRSSRSSLDAGSRSSTSRRRSRSRDRDRRRTSDRRSKSRSRSHSRDRRRRRDERRHRSRTRSPAKRSSHDRRDHRSKSSSKTSSHSTKETFSSVEPSKIEPTKVLDISVSSLSSQDDHLGKDDAPDDQFGPALPPAMHSKAPERKPSVEEENVESIGPALPPHLAARKLQVEDHSPEQSKPTIGPALPPAGFIPAKDAIAGDSSESELSPFSEEEPDADENDDFIGPAIPGASTSKAQLELEKRALEMKLRRFDSEDAKASNATAREDWMLELPDIRKVPDMGLGARQFRTREKPEIGDRSVWTDTPSDKERKKATGGGHSSRDAKRDLEEETEQLRIAQRDKQQEEQVKRHKKKHKRDKSLLDIHQKKLKKEKKDKDEPTRRPFDRNVDLHANRFDDAQKKAIMKKAQLLDTRFSSGGSKFL